MLHGRRLVQRQVRAERRNHDVVTEHVGHRDGVRGRGDALRGALLDPRDGRDDLVELDREVIEFTVGQGQSRQPGQVGHFGAVNGHEAILGPGPGQADGIYGRAAASRRSPSGTGAGTSPAGAAAGRGSGAAAEAARGPGAGVVAEAGLAAGAGAGLGPGGGFVAAAGGGGAGGRRASQSAAAAALSGWLNCQPWATSQPMARRLAATCGDSTPSATERMPSPRSRCTADRTISSGSGLLVPAAAEDGSIFTSPMHISFSRPTEQYPVMKSSTLSSMPR